jgi:hypothetical protein
MTADFGGAAMLALPVPALISSDEWRLVASEALVVVTVALALAAGALAATRKSTSHKGEPPCIHIRCWIRAIGAAGIASRRKPAGPRENRPTRPTSSAAVARWTRSSTKRSSSPSRRAKRW